MIQQSTRDGVDQLEELLGEPIIDAQHRERTAFAQAIGPSSGRVVIYGAGNLGRRTLENLREAGIETLAFVDKNPMLWSRTVSGVPVCSPEEASATFGERDLFIVCLCHPTRTGGVESVTQGLRGLGCRHVTSFAPLFWSDPDRYLPYYMWDLPSRVLEASERIRSAFRVFDGDATSQATFIRQVRLRLHGDFGCLPSPADHEQYFPPLFRPIKNEYFVDCGAFDGDSIRVFLEWCGDSFAKILAFEPDPQNLAALQQFASTHAKLGARLELRSAAVGDRAGVVRFAASGTTSAAPSEVGDIEVSCESLDRTLGTERATFIKMDIEGEELSALSGARQIIRRDCPVLAICVYHRQNHLWEVPLQIAALTEDSRFALTGYCLDGFETVCYAIPQERYVS